tara:strand:- start:49 stop:693 length:645 start_codon:yes stop_codon:yes gene_type:complete
MTNTPNKHPLSDTLESVITNETYGMFPVPISKFTLPNHEGLKQEILLWMQKSEILKKSGRESITHNVVQIGENNKLLNDLPNVADAFKTAIAQHNDNSMHYDCDLKVSESYLELANQDAIYAPHETSNCLFHSIYLINFDDEKHSYYKFRKNVGSNHYPIMQFNSKQLTQYNMTEATFKMNEGDIITFPSNLTFGFDSNPNNERITLSANIVPN